MRQGYGDGKETVRLGHDHICQAEADKEVFSGEKILDTGIKHGTVTLMAGGMSMEITTYRVESGYSDHRHPDKVAFSGELADDLARRDFTINAMALDREGRFDRSVRRP